MCGYCMEFGFAIDLLEKEKKGEALGDLFPWPMAEFYLQETNSPSRFLTRITTESTQEHLGFSSETLLCKGIEVLLTQCFDSTEFQKLLRNDYFKNCLANACSHTEREKFSVLARRFGWQGFELLYDQQTFMVRERAEKLLDAEFLRDESHGLLRHYIRWWLQGKGLQKNDLLKRMEETGTMDPIEDVTKDEHQTFQIIFPALWLSLFMLAKVPASQQTLLDIISHSTAGVPLFNAHDLWLQRRAALLLYDLEGLGPFLEKGCRGTLLYYLDLKRGLSANQLTVIAEALRSLPEGAFRDDFFDTQVWLTGSN